jgi:hypothetical protein
MDHYGKFFPFERAALATVFFIFVVLAIKTISLVGKIPKRSCALILAHPRDGSAEGGGENFLFHYNNIFTAPFSSFSQD